MRQDSRPMTGFYTMGVAGVILTVFLLLVLSGARTYRGVVEGQEKNNRSRALLSYFLASVKSGDAQGAVRVFYAEGAPVVSVADGASGYGLRIYQHEGKLMGYYGKLDQEPDPQEALVVGETEKFQVEDLGNATYVVTTDAGRALFHVRSDAD